MRQKDGGILKIMYSVVIVDDDEIIREGICDLIDWEELNVSISYAASNGVDALNFIQNNHVDLLITDVSMPDMNGIELIAKVKERYTYIKRIVISAYDDFAFVKEAAKLGIENYILKPIDEKELTNTLVSTVEKLDTETLGFKNSEQDFFVFQSNILSRLVYEEIDEFELQEKADFIHFDLYAKEYLLCYLKSQQEAVPAYFLKKLQALFQYDNSERSFCFRDLEENYVIIFCGNNLSKDDEIMKHRIRKNIEYMEEEFLCKINVTISEYVDSYRKLPLCYRNIRKQQEDILLRDKGNVLETRVLRYVKAHFMEDINLKTISYEFGMNAFYLGQLFKEWTNISFTNYITHLRIEKAKELLKDSSYRISEIAYRVGYFNVNYFYTIFKRKTGMSPAAYREQNLY